jgi:sugar/nucleoside kinase (ribokinase family)
MDVSAAFFGRTTLDVLYSLDALPAEDTKVFAHAFRTAPGGPACNAAITQTLLGGKATLFTAIGTGLWAGAIRDELIRRSIALIDLAAGTPYETPLTTVLLNRTRATRTIVNPPQPQVELPILDEGWNEDWGTPPRIVLTDGFHLKETLPLLRAIRDAGTPLILDGGSWKPGTSDLAPLLNAAICSERFAVSGASADPESTLQWFAAQGVLHAAVTRGPRPTLALDRGRRFEIEIPPIAAIDTSAAGDVLHGAFCYHYGKSGHFEESLRSAAEIATQSCQTLGIEGWINSTEAPKTETEPRE